MPNSITSCIKNIWHLYVTQKWGFWGSKTFYQGMEVAKAFSSVIINCQHSVRRVFIYFSLYYAIGKLFYIKFVAHEILGQVLGC